MKNLFLAALLIVGITAFAQDKTEKRPNRESMTKEQKVDFQVKRMTKDLNLNEKQAKEIEALVSKQVDKREAKKAEMKDDKAKDRAEMKAEMEANQTAMSAELKKILTPEQFSKWEKNRDERKEKMKEKVAERREKKGANDIPESK